LVVLACVLALVLPVMFMGALVAIAGSEVSPSELAMREVPQDLLGLYRAAASSCPGLPWTVLAAIHKVETDFGRGPARSPKGASGPMQFMPATFDRYAVDGDRDGRVAINDLEDAMFTAAGYLCANGAGDPTRLPQAVWNYNHSWGYVDQVLDLATSYGSLESSSLPPADTAQVLNNERIVLSPRARGDLQNGVVDPRLVSLLAWISERHTIDVTVFKTGHSKYTRSGSVSNHYLGRGADIFSVDGRPVDAFNRAALSVVLELASVRGVLRPDEFGHPFGPIGFPGGFTDADHDDHVHIGYDS
jgi:Transglycosylase SLT domain